MNRVELDGFWMDLGVGHVLDRDEGHLEDPANLCECVRLHLLAQRLVCRMRLRDQCGRLTPQVRGAHSPDVDARSRRRALAADLGTHRVRGLGRKPEQHGVSHKFLGVLLGHQASHASKSRLAVAINDLCLQGNDRRADDNISHPLLGDVGAGAAAADHGHGGARRERGRHCRRGKHSTDSGDNDVDGQAVHLPAEGLDDAANRRLLDEALFDEWVEELRLLLHGNHHDHALHPHARLREEFLGLSS